MRSREALDAYRTHLLEEVDEEAASLRKYRWRMGIENFTYDQLDESLDADMELATSTAILDLFDIVEELEK